MRALIIGDSLAMPRLNCDYDQTWIAMLVKRYPKIEFIDKCRRSSSALRLVNDGAGAGDLRRGADVLEYYNPQFVITQIGITDCSPRLLKRDRVSTKVINSMPAFISTPIYGFVRKYKGRTLKNNDLSPEQFKSYYENYIQRAKDLGVKIFCVKISPVDDRMLAKSPLLQESIDLYNSQLDSLSLQYENFITIMPYTKEEVSLYSDDGYHVIGEGHKVLFLKVSKHINQFYED